MSSTPPSAASIADATVILSLEIGRVSNRKKLDKDTDTIETEIDRDVLHVSVELFDAEELKACNRFLWNLKAKVREKTVPSFFRGGMYMVKIEAVQQVHDLLEKSKGEFAPLVQAFADVVDQRREESKDRLGPAYDPGMFPSKYQVTSLFGIHWQWLTMATPSSLKKVNMALFEQEKQKAEETLRLAVEDITSMLTFEAKKLCDHLVDRLTPGEDGKAKTFHASSVSKISEFLANFNMRNVGSSDELNGQIERMRALMSGISPEDLRKSDQLREDVAKGFKEVALQLDQIVIDKPSRFISLKRKET